MAGNAVQVHSADPITASLIRGTTATALLLTLCCAPVFASTGVDALCDRPSDEPLVVPVIDLESMVELADHGRTDSVSAGATDASVDLLAPPRLSPKSEEILRKIFDESLARSAVGESDTTQNVPQAAPLAELAPPELLEQDAAGDEEISATDAEEAERMSPRLPGMSDDDSLRYREQMFRTDI